MTARSSPLLSSLLTRRTERMKQPDLGVGNRDSDCTLVMTFTVCAIWVSSIIEWRGLGPLVSL